MDDAQRQMQSGSGEKSAKSVDEARKYLEQVRKDLEKEKRRYEELRQEQVLFRLLQDLKEARKEQERIRDAVKQVSDAAAASGGRLARTQKKQLKTLAGEETAAREKVDERAKAIAEEGSDIFGGALEMVGIDMTEVARLLEDEQHDVYVRALMDQVVRQLSDLIGGFEDEIERRKQDDGGQKPGDPPPSGKPPLVPPTVEIKLLRRMQLELNARLEGFWRDNPSVKEGRLDERQRRTLERLYNQQSHIANGLENLVKRIYGREDR